MYGCYLRYGGARRLSATIGMIICLLFAALVVCSGCDRPVEGRIVSQRDGLIVAEVISTGVGSNMIGEEPARLLGIYLPPGYPDGKNGYPVLYYLHGFGESSLALARYCHALDEYFTQHPDDAFIVVGIDGRCSLGGSFWRNSPVTGAWEDFAAVEVPRFIEENFKVRASPTHRGIAGFSMGGNAALHLSFEHPDKYRAVFATAPSVAPLRDPRRFLEFGSDRRRQSILASMAFETVLIDESLDREELENPRLDAATVELARSRCGAVEVAECIRKMGPESWESMDLHIECGSLNPEWLRDATRDVANILDRAGIEHEFTEFDGGHSLSGKRFGTVLIPFFATAFRS